MNNLKKLRKEKKLTVRELSELVNINYATLSRLENDESQLTDDYIEILSGFYGVSADYLLGISKIQNFIPVEKLPVYSFIYASEPILRNECFLGYEIAPGETDVKNSIYLVNHDDSMKSSSGLIKGDLLIIEFTNQAENNHVVIVAKDNDPGIVRRVIITEQSTIFIADSEYPVITNTTDWKILARVRRVTRAIA